MKPSFVKTPVRVLDLDGDDARADRVGGGRHGLRIGVQFAVDRRGHPLR
jgi:hypothetical protein